MTFIEEILKVYKFIWLLVYKLVIIDSDIDGILVNDKVKDIHKQKRLEGFNVIEEAKANSESKSLKKKAVNGKDSSTY